MVHVGVIKLGRKGILLHRLCDTQLIEELVGHIGHLTENGQTGGLLDLELVSPGLAQQVIGLVVLDLLVRILVVGAPEVSTAPPSNPHCCRGQRRSLLPA